MEIPSVNELKLPYLRLAQKLPEVRLREAVDLLAEEFKLTAQDKVLRFPCGDKKLYHNVSVARDKLVQEKLLESRGRGVVAITSLGEEYLRRFSDLPPDDQVTEPVPSCPGDDAYSVEDILKDGCFLDRSEIDRVLARLRTKKNLILQGPPGTGKTWLAKRLAFALMGRKDAGKVRAVQFHPNLSYEDFVRGWRPTGEGKLSLTDGVFMESIKAALDDPSSKFVVVIEEINRGNPAQIFGELLTLLEADKRTPDEALELCYPDADGKRRPVHIPENLYVVGTMNVADRSLAMVDLALRRRFAFVELEPKLGKVWRDWVVKERAVESTLAADIERRISDLNVQIAADKRLGKQFRIGHSYVTPTYQLDAGGTKEWFRQVVETEIAPLLDEYWFDAPDEAQEATKRLTQGW